MTLSPSAPLPFLDLYDTTGPQGCPPSGGLPTPRAAWVSKRTGDACCTQQRYAKLGVVTEEMAFVAAREGCSVDLVGAAHASSPTSSCVSQLFNSPRFVSTVSEVARGRAIIPGARLVVSLFGSCVAPASLSFPFLLASQPTASTRSWSPPS